ncbi:MAG: M23 family metallopeptidase, partial [Actinomycetota bacterium]|nr:M23 family metallopeptidase [Actinomycetota bacterium]
SRPTTTAAPPATRPPATTTTTRPPDSNTGNTTTAALDRCPVKGPVSFQDWWHAPRSGGRLHEGLDMFAPMGAPVVAPVSGTVMHTEYPLGGKVFRMWGDNGWFYYGAHLSGFAADGWVSAGTVIGYVGDSGNAQGTSPHLHFEAHPVQGTPVNPYGAARALC